MKKLTALLLALAMMFSLAGGSGSKEEGAKEDGKAKIAVIFGLGGLGDQSYNDLA